MIRKFIHYCDMARCYAHKYYWHLVSHFGRVQGIVLMYHYITNEYVDIRPGCKHTPRVFEETLLRLKSEGYIFVSIDEMMEIVKSKGTKKFAVITFDDIMDNVYTNAYPILKKHNLPFALFVATTFIDRGDGVSTIHLKEMAADTLCTIGAHSVTHCNLRKCDNAMEEIIESKFILEKKIGRSIDYFAYPYGKHEHVSRKVMQQAKAAGYKCAFGTIQAPISEASTKNMFYLPRMVLNA